METLNAVFKTLMSLVIFCSIMFNLSDCRDHAERTSGPLDRADSQILFALFLAVAVAAICAVWS